MKDILRNLKDWYNDVRYTKAYRAYRAINKEIALRQEALDGTDYSPLTVNFIAFLKRRIEKLKADKIVADKRLNDIINGI